jgi:hypothetical protein
MHGRMMTPEQRSMMRQDVDRQHTTAYYVSNGRKASRGTEHLKPTQAYPQGFGAHHAVAFYDCGLCDPRSSMNPGHPLSTDDDESAGIEELADDEVDPYLIDLHLGTDRWVGAIDREEAVPMR